MDLVVATLVAASACALLSLTSGTFFIGDDWGLLAQGLTDRGLVRPYNDHFSFTILAVYRLLAEMFGLVYLPFRITGVLALAAIPSVLYATTRSRFGSLIAAVAALLVVGAPRLELQPYILNHYLVAIGAIVCAFALDRGKDLLLLAGLGLALSAASGGLAVGVACIVHLGLTRARWRRWLATLGPLALWALWYLTRSTDSAFQPVDRPSLTEAIGYAGNVVLSPFDGRDGLVVAALVLAFLGYIWRRKLADPANLGAWGAALLAWGCGLAYQRGSQGTVAVFGRYQLLALTFVLLAVVPREGIAKPPRRLMWAGLALTVVVVALRWVTVWPDLEERANRIRAFGELSQCTAIEGGELPPITAEQISAVVDAYGLGDAECDERPLVLPTP